MPATKTSSKSKKTTDHDLIRKWIEERDGQPARVKGTGKTAKGGRSGGLLRVDFGDPEPSLEPVSWEEFFEVFDKNGLAFLYQETTQGKKSRFFKFVNRDGVEGEDEEEKDKDEKEGKDDATDGTEEEGDEEMEDVDVELDDDLDEDALDDDDADDGDSAGKDE